VTLRSLLRKLLRATEPDTEVAAELSSRAVFPISDYLRHEYERRGVVIEDQPDTFKQPPVDWDRLPP